MVNKNVYMNLERLLLVIYKEIVPNKENVQKSRSI